MLFCGAVGGNGQASMDHYMIEQNSGENLRVPQTVP